MNCLRPALPRSDHSCAIQPKSARRPIQQAHSSWQLHSSVLANLELQLRCWRSLNPPLVSILTFCRCSRPIAVVLGAIATGRRVVCSGLENQPRVATDSQQSKANLLDDLGRLDEAREDSHAPLDEHPDYADARTNLNRLSFQNESSPAPVSQGEQSPEPVQGWSLADPLLLAFSEEEVAESGLRKPAKPGTQAASLLEALPDAGRAERWPRSDRAGLQGSC